MEIKTLRQIQLNDIDLILLDLDNTLYVYKRTHEKALHSVIEDLHSSLGIDKDRLVELYGMYRKRVNTKHEGMAVSHSRLFYLQGMVEELCGYTDVKLITSLYNKYWDVFIESIDLCDDVMDFLKSSLIRKIPIVLVSDMTAEMQFRKITKMGINKYLNYIVTSEEAGCEKPNPSIFELAISKISGNRKIRRIAVVGDDTRKDVFSSSEYHIDIYHILRDE